MFIRIDQMRAHMVLDDLSHEARHGAACAGDEVHDLLAPRLARKRALYAVNLSAEPAHARQQFFLIANRMAHGPIIAYPPTLYEQSRARATRAMRRLAKDEISGVTASVFRRASFVLSSGHNALLKGRRMNKNTIRISLAALAFLLAFSISAPSFAGPSADIRRLENDFNSAYAANDLDKYFGFYADDALLWFPEGRTNVPAYQKEWTEYIKGGAALEQAGLSDLHIRVSPRGDTAIASYLLHVRTRAADKSVTDEDFQETDVWFKTAAGWRITHVHYSPAPKAGKS
jgi:ketosteroid isomerase-like protein